MRSAASGDMVAIVKESALASRNAGRGFSDRLFRGAEEDRAELEPGDCGQVPIVTLGAVAVAIWNVKVFMAALAAEVHCTVKVSLGAVELNGALMR